MKTEYKFILSDSLKALKNMDNDFYKLIITSPPYNLGKEYEDKTPFQSYLNEQDKIIKELVRVLHPNGSICWQVGNYVHKGEVFPLDFFYYNLFKNHHLKLRNRIIWHFGHGLHSSKRFSGRYETILWFTKNDDYTFNLDNVRVPSKYPGKKHFKGPKKGEYSSNPSGKNPSDVWELIRNDWDKLVWEIPNVKSNHVEKTEHPCQFPIELVERCLLALTNEDDWTLDPYAGVGTTIIASLKNNRNSIGIERFNKYIDIGIKRIQDYENGELKSRPMEKPIYDHTKSNLSQRPIIQKKIISDENL